MSAHNFPLNLDRCLRNGFFNVADPGASGTIDIVGGKGQAICRLVTAGAESRALPAAAGFGVGQKLLVYAGDLVGAATITGADTGSVILSADGEHAEFVVVEDDFVNQWNAVSLSGQTGQGATVVTRAVVAAAANLVPVSGGADRTIMAATPAALGVVDINTGDAATDTALIALANALQAFGLVTHTWT